MSLGVISPRTNFELCQAAKEYANIVGVPCYMPVGSFATAYAGVGLGPFKTFITGDETSLAIAFEGESMGRQLVNVDIFAEGPASIVQPGFYDEDGNRDSANGKFRRLVVRLLTDQEGHALISDLNTIATTIPKDRRK